MNDTVETVTDWCDVDNWKSRAICLKIVSNLFEYKELKLQQPEKLTIFWNFSKRRKVKTKLNINYTRCIDSSRMYGTYIPKQKFDAIRKFHYFAI